AQNPCTRRSWGRRLRGPASAVPRHPHGRPVSGVQRGHPRHGAQRHRHRHRRPPDARPERAAELDDVLRRVRRPALQRAGPGEHGQRVAAAPRVELSVRARRPARHPRHLLVRGGAHRGGRGDVRFRVGRLRVGAGRRHRPGAVAVPARDPAGRAALLRQREPRGGGGQGQGDHGHPERPPRRARRHQRAEGVGAGVRRRARRRERHHGAAGGEEHGDRGQLRRRVRRARAHGRLRHRHGPAPLAALQRAPPGRARHRDVGRRRRVGARRRHGLDHRHLRSGAGPGVLGHRQPRPRLRRPRAPGEQPVHQLRRRHRSGRRHHPLALPVDADGRVGLRRREREHPDRPRRAEAAGPLRQERLLLPAGPHRRPAGDRRALRAHHLGRHRPHGPRDAPAEAHGAGHGDLPRPGGRQGVAARRVQSAHGPAVHAGDRGMRRVPGAAGGVPRGALLPGRRGRGEGRAVGAGEGDRPHDRPRGVVVARPAPHGGVHPDHRGRPGVHGRAQRLLQRLARAHGRGAVALPDGQRHPQQSRDVLGERQAVHRRPHRLGRMAGRLRARDVRRAARHGAVRVRFAGL
ncbi:MAG: Quino(hemo)protein alcohol dehydrogenase, PQQ-dependent, partial [uncultured Gemmatimonadetes bacterium]